MGPLIVKGDTLGQKHRNYNKLVNEAIQNNPNQQITAIHYEESDMDNLFKIDIACNRRNVEYILEALKCEDMVYVSRIMKQSTWLITDQQYSYIINPEYLHQHLYPHMTSKAFNKLILHVRLNLKDEKRVEEFFNYYEQDFKKSLKWLPGCSVPFIENVIQKHANDIPEYLLKRLYEKSITILETFLRNYTTWYYKQHMIEPAKFLIKRNLGKFLDIIESLKPGESFNFGPKYTRIVMEENPVRVMNNLEKYVDFLDIPTFVKYLKKEEVKGFILTHIKNKETRSWFRYKKIKYLLNQLPFEERFDFVNKLFIEKSFEDQDLVNETWDDIVEYCNIPVQKLSSTKHIWSWYAYAPFDKAFEDLKHWIRNESNPTDRLWILRTMLTCAGSNQKNILTLLKYYNEHHMSEPFKFKVQFVNRVIIKTNPNNYDEETFRYFNDIFNSLEVATKYKDSVETCVKFIILYNAIHDRDNPENIENKFNFDDFINYDYNKCKHKFNFDEREKIFNYFYKYYISKITNNIKTEKEFDETVDIIVKVLKLLEKWNKDLKDHPFILQKIKDFIITRKENSWSCDLSGVYHFKKSWRRILFPESIILSPTENTCINALKHDPELLEKYRNEINSYINNNVSFERFLKKIRIDWHQPLADSFKTTFNENLNQKSSHKTSIKGLCTLLSQKELENFVHKYVPKEAKIDPSESDDLLINIRKNIGTCMHLARLHPPLRLALMYAKGDYLHYVLPSLNAIFYNMSSDHIRKYVAELLNTSVSLQKHGIRVAFDRLDHKELKNVFLELWKSSENRSIRKDIFCETYKKLCRESDETVILDVWELLGMFIDKLSFEENKKIYLTLSNFENIPLSVRTAFWQKSYDFFKKTPAKLNCKSFFDELNTKINDFMEFLDIDFMRTMFFENFDKKFSTQKYDNCQKIALYLLSTKSESVQKERYEEIFVPLVEKALAMWDKRNDDIYYTRNNLREIFDYMSTEFEDLVLKKEMVFPIAMYTSVLNKLQSNLSMKENYVLLSYVKLSLGFIKTLYDLKTKVNDSKEKLDKSEEIENLYKDSAPVFGRLCLDYLKEDVSNNGPTIYIIFAHVLNLIFDQYVQFDKIYRMSVLKSFLASKDFIEGYLLVMELIPRYNYFPKYDERALKLEILKEIRLHPSEEIAMHYWHTCKDSNDF
ncbi:uncharacterized protein [Maniola hyperantus]|uniref:uncharacterized protein isoform X2 n=1 Tax=Aphantopus hyperantus TaxID=2795564 RepID=UPI001568E2C1|nr:uncharacterized protein LOC117993425 [Maniola hyperantus]